jgi:hypothetical protein
MTESEWLSCTDPTKMLEFVTGKASDRKMRLFACACCRRTWHLLCNDNSRSAVEMAERYADEFLDPDQLARVRDKAREARRRMPSQPAWRAASAALEATNKQGGRAALACVIDAALAVNVRDRNNCDPDELEIQGWLLRCVIGNPFRRVCLEPAWRTATVTDLAAATYEERVLPSGELDSTRLGVLADALEEAGCTDYATLDHLRSAGPHVRGCWSVDLVLAKE